MEQASDRNASCDPGVAAGVAEGSASNNSIGLTAQERRNFELIVIHRLVHRQGLPAVDIQTLRGRRGRPLCVVRDRIWHPDGLALGQRRQLLPFGLGPLLVCLAVIAAAEPDLGEALQQ